MELENEVLRWVALEDGEANELRALKLVLVENRSIPLGMLANWLGEWRHGGASENANESLIDFEAPDSPECRFLVAIHLCRVGARLFERGGYLEDAARELLQVCSIVTRVLWWSRSVEAMHGWTLDASAPSWRNAATKIARLFAAVFQKPADGGWRNDLMLHLARFVVEALGEANRLFRQSRQRMTAMQSTYQLGDLVPSDALTLACSLGLWLKSEPWTEPVPADATGIEEDLRQLIGSWTGAQCTARFDEVLRHSLKRQRYPLLNRLNGLEVLIDDFVVGWPSADVENERLAQARVDLEELLELNEQYAAPLHFTPHQSGTTCALFYLGWRRLGLPTEEPGPFLDRVFRTAERDLRASEEMFTLRRAFYRSISSLYYLYDDFNDRHIHFKHALQMAGAELTTVLRHLLEVVGAPENTEARSDE